MKIGIITWFKYENYGTALQAIALQKYLRNMEYNVEMINFELDDTCKNKKSSKNSILLKIYYIIAKIIFRYEKKRHNASFEKKSKDFKKIIDRNCIVTKKVENEDEYIKLCNSYDIIIFGSDQIWNPNWYHPFYYGNYDKIKSKLIAYAPSFGVNSLPENKIEEIRKALKRFSDIALREEQGCKIVNDLINVRTRIVVDPTLLITKSEWEMLEDNSSTPSERYILCYFLSDNPYHWRAVKKFAKKAKLKLVIIPHDGFSYVQSRNVIRTCNVANFLSLINNAEFVITDSFHAIVFSIIYKKKFIVFERHNPNSKFAQNSRIYNLLNITNTENCLLKYNTSNIEKVNNIDYDSVDKKINELIKNSKEYILNAIK